MGTLIANILLSLWFVTFQDHRSASVQRPDSDIAGCYALTRSEWQPRIDLGRDSSFVQLPQQLIIDSTGVARRSGWRILRSSGSEANQTPIGRTMWRRIGPRRIEVVWAPSGLSGVSGRFHRTEMGFNGEIQTFW